tara:strand:- start:1423 stop:2307 length:885 start_codon:yes stop_codon:yes gene_type:complete
MDNDHQNDELSFLKHISNTTGLGPGRLVTKVDDNAVIGRRGTTIASKRHSDITMFFDQFIKDKYEKEKEKANFSLKDDKETQKKKRIRQSYIVVFYLLKLLITLEFTDIFEKTIIKNKGRSFTAHTFADTISGSGLRESIYNAYKEENYELLIKEIEPKIIIKDFETAFKDDTKPEITLKEKMDDIEDLLNSFNKESFLKIKSLIKDVKFYLEVVSSPKTKLIKNSSTPTTSTATNRTADAAKGTSTALNLTSFLGLQGGKKSRKRCNKSKRKNKNNKTRKAKPKRKSRKNSRS